MPNPDLTDEEAAALVRCLHHAIDYDPFPLAPRLDPRKAILAKLEPPAPQPEPLPPLKPAWGRASGAPSGGGRRWGSSERRVADPKRKA
jgi:hypothetical protein